MRLLVMAALVEAPVVEIEAEGLDEPDGEGALALGRERPLGDDDVGLSFLALQDLAQEIRQEGFEVGEKGIDFGAAGPRFVAVEQRVVGVEAEPCALGGGGLADQLQHPLQAGKDGGKIALRVGITPRRLARRLRLDHSGD
jgi:hypothetical protein